MRFVGPLSIALVVVLSERLTSIEYCARSCSLSPTPLLYASAVCTQASIDFAIFVT